MINHKFNIYIYIYLFTLSDFEYAYIYIYYVIVYTVYHTMWEQPLRHRKAEHHIDVFKTAAKEYYSCPCSYSQMHYMIL